MCDAIFAVDETPPPILTDVPEYVKALLFHARDEPLEVVPDSPEARRKGWQRIVLLFNFFFPGSAVVSQVTSLVELLLLLQQIDRSPVRYGLHLIEREIVCIISPLFWGGLTCVVVSLLVRSRATSASVRC